MSNKSNSYPENIAEKVAQFAVMEECELMLFELEANLIFMKDGFPKMHNHTFSRAVYMLNQAQECLKLIKKREEL